MMKNNFYLFIFLCVLFININNSNAEFTIQIISAENNEQINNTVIENHKYYFEILKNSPVNITSKH